MLNRAESRNQDDDFRGNGSSARTKGDCLQTWLIVFFPHSPRESKDKSISNKKTDMSVVIRPMNITRSPEIFWGSFLSPHHFRPLMTTSSEPQIDKVSKFQDEDSIFEERKGCYRFTRTGSTA